MVYLDINLNLNNFTSYGGSCKVQKILGCENLKSFLDTNLSKRSGEKMSDIFSYLINKTITQTGSIAGFKRLNDPLLQFNSHRTTLGRQIDKFAQYSTPLLNFFIPKEFFNKKDLLIIIDSTLLKAEGNTYKNTMKLYDHNKGMYYYGYKVCTFILSDGKSFYPYKFIINDESKESILQILEEIREFSNAFKVAFDAGFKGDEFFRELHTRKFLFYTKATMNWIFNYGKNYKSKDIWASIQSQKGVYQEREVFRDDLKLRLISRKKDNRLILTNDFSCSMKKGFSRYIQRWDVETFFKEAKETLFLQKFIRRKTLNSIIAHITIIFASFSILMQLSRRLNLKVKGFKLFIETYIKIKGFVKKNKHKYCLNVQNLSQKILKFFNLRIKLNGGEI